MDDQVYGRIHQYYLQASSLKPSHATPYAISNGACMRQRAWVWTRAQAGLCMCMFRCVFGDWLLRVCVRNVGHWPVQGLWNRISHPHRTATLLRHCRESTEWVQIGQYWALPAAAAALQPALALVPGVLQRVRKWLFARGRAKECQETASNAGTQNVTPAHTSTDSKKQSPARTFCSNDNRLIKGR